MHIRVEHVTNWADLASPLLAVGLYEGDGVKGALKGLDGALGGAITSLLEGGEYKGEADKTLLLYTLGRVKPERLLLLGLGKREEFDYEQARQAAGLAAQKAKELKLEHLHLHLLGEDTSLEKGRLAQAIVEGLSLALYNYKIKGKEEEEDEGKEVKEATILCTDASYLKPCEEGSRIGSIMAEATILARDLSNAPSNAMTPTRLAEEAERLAQEHGLECRVLGKEELERLGMGGILGVAKGSSEPPRLIILSYKGAGEEEPVALVGKGITFDAGGISLKPAGKMEEMKHDKSGAAAVIAAMKAIAKLKLPLNVVALAPATENMPGGSAQKPGDVIRHYGGKTSEVLHTDAEGRLILADALAYALEMKPKAIIDLATLTGACIVALGTSTAGLFTNSDELARRMEEASRFTGERVWRLPLGKEYEHLIKSDVADVKNVYTSSAGGPAGAIVGAMYLREFVKDTPWAHLDIAGTAWIQDGSLARSYLPKGATGYGVRLVVEMLRAWASER